MSKQKSTDIKEDIEGVESHEEQPTKKVLASGEFWVENERGISLL